MEKYSSGRRGLPAKEVDRVFPVREFKSLLLRQTTDESRWFFFALSSKKVRFYRYFWDFAILWVLKARESFFYFYTPFIPPLCRQGVVKLSSEFLTTCFVHEIFTMMFFTYWENKKRAAQEREKSLRAAKILLNVQAFS